MLLVSMGLFRFALNLSSIPSVEGANLVATVGRRFEKVRLVSMEVISVTRKKSPNVYKSCSKMISLEK